ncbi:hypothetical protein KTO58_19700 [Chitinophaga pendula]|uniref:hypothetical protein n=1 Tax=Chitinophaga TaxID=79328 RepID=UPI000BAFE313|nr:MULTISPECIES: hypothetical protein [Chitinophaga]ASZ11107.1 hypothetical protein CK934_09100 [Chitinophaga sp. MD30]UCJ05895.1 hypothetical protein KTO58_19700 [Chitinophaga pendula]
MAKQTLNTLKNWFVTYAKPVQSQFWDWLDSFRHKDDKITVSDLSNEVVTILNNLPSTESINQLNQEVQNHIKNKNNPHEVTKAHLQLDNVDNTADLQKPLSNPVRDLLTQKADLIDGKVAISQLPAIAITDTFVVDSEADMLALPAQRGDVAIRSDLNASFILAADDPTQLTNWKRLVSNAGGTPGLQAVLLSGNIATLPIIINGIGDLLTSIQQGLAFGYLKETETAMFFSRSVSGALAGMTFVAKQIELNGDVYINGVNDPTPGEKYLTLSRTDSKLVLKEMSLQAVTAAGNKTNKKIEIEDLDQKTGSAPTGLDIASNINAGIEISNTLNGDTAKLNVTAGTAYLHLLSQNAHIVREGALKFNVPTGVVTNILYADGRMTGKEADSATCFATLSQVGAITDKGIKLSVRVIVGSYTFTADDYTVINRSTTGNPILTLPDPKDPAIKGRIFVLVEDADNATSNAMSWTPAVKYKGGNYSNFNNAALSAFKSIQVQSDGDVYMVIGLA